LLWPKRASAASSSPPPLGALPWRSGTLLGEVGLSLLGSCIVGQQVRGRGTSVDVGAAAPELSCFRCRPLLLGWMGRRLVWCAASGPVWSVWGVPVLASVRGLRTGVDIGAAASKTSSHGVSSLSVGAVGSSARVVRGLEAGVSRCVVLVFASFSYKLVV
jgi:hypothetical protein